MAAKEMLFSEQARVAILRGVAASNRSTTG